MIAAKWIGFASNFERQKIQPNQIWRGEIPSGSLNKRRPSKIAKAARSVQKMGNILDRRGHVPATNQKRLPLKKRFSYLQMYPAGT
jgi:hypothetical protein